MSWSPTATLILVAAFSGVLAAAAFRLLSNQRRMTEIADHSRARLLAIRLFPDDLRGIFASLGGLIALSAKRVLHSLPSLLVLGPLFVIVLVQLAQWFEYRPLTAGESAIVTARMTADNKLWAGAQDATLEVPAGVQVLTPALRDAQAHTISWRIGVEDQTKAAAGPGIVRLATGADVFEKQLAVASPEVPAAIPVSQLRPGPGLFERLIHPREQAFSSDSTARAILIDYPESPARSIGWLLGWPWWALFLIVSVAAAFLAQPLIGVKF